MINNMLSSLHFSPLTVCYVLAAIVMLVATIYVYQHERHSRASALLIGFTLCFTPWCLLRGLTMGLDDPDQIVAISRLAYGFVCFSIPVVFWFLMIVLQREQETMLRIRFHLAIGAALGLLCAGTPWILSGWHRRPWGIEASLGGLAPLLVLWIAILIITNTVEIWRARKLTPVGSPGRHRLNWLFLGSLAIYSEAFDLLTNFAVLPMNLHWLSAPLGFLSLPAFTLITAYISRKYSLTEVNAPLAAAQIANLYSGVVLVIDNGGVIRYASEHSSRVLGLSPAALQGRNCRRALGEDFSLAHLRSLAAAPKQGSQLALSRPNTQSGQMRELVIAAKVVRDQRDRPLALTCLINDVTEQKRQQEGQLDALTRLPKRADFLKMVQSAIDQAVPTGTPSFTLCLLRIGKLRAINEDLGYRAGDQVLLETAKRLRALAGSKAEVARLDDDEFGILLGERLSDDEAREKFEALHRTCELPVAVDGHSLSIHAYLGVARSSRRISASALVGKAGLALQNARQSLTRIGSEMESVGPAPSRTRLEAEIRRGFEAGEFTTYYQPIIDLLTERVCGFEALLRWQHPAHGLMLPGAFLALAEQIGLIAEMDRSVIVNACQDLQRLQTACKNPTLHMCINLDRSTLARSNVVDDIAQAISAAGIAPACVRIELQERLLLAPEMRARVASLRELGVGICIDDFGVGYSALSRLHELPLTHVKIDRSFVKATPHSEGGRILVRNIVELAGNLNLHVVAEGVSTAQELALVRGAGCVLAQGFQFSPAVKLQVAARMASEPWPAHAFAGAAATSASR